MDLWKYNMDSNIWSLMGGNNSIDILPVYSGGSRSPGSRYDYGGWMDSSNTLWLFGGKYSGTGKIGYCLVT